MNKYLQLTILSVLGLGAVLTPNLAHSSDVYPPITESNSNEPRKVRRRISPFLTNKNTTTNVTNGSKDSINGISSQQNQVPTQSQPDLAPQGEVTQQRDITPKRTSVNQPQVNQEKTTTEATRNIYSCVNYENKPTTIVDTARGRIKLIVWESDYFANSGWTPRKRCEAVSARFQKFSDDRSLKYVSTGVVKKKYKVICVSSPRPGRGYDCNDDGLLLTLQPNDNPSKVLKTLFVNAAKVGGTAVVRGETAVSIDRILNRSEVISTEDGSNVSNTIETQQPVINQQPVNNVPRIRSTQPQTIITNPNSNSSICTPPLCD